MYRKSVSVCAVAVAFLGFALLRGIAAEDPKPIDEGKAEDFKGKTYDLKEKGEVHILMSFPADHKATLTVKGEKKSDVNLYVHDAAKKEVAKDESPGPDCEVSFTPKEAGKYTLILKNLGPGDNKAALKVAISK
jgi:hypothetical protein